MKSFIVLLFSIFIVIHEVFPQMILNRDTSLICEENGKPIEAIDS